MRIVSEEEFSALVSTLPLHQDQLYADIGCVTGPGRSGAIAAVYVSHALRVPFIPYGSVAPAHLGTILVVDTARQTGKTMRKAVRRYEKQGVVRSLVFFEEPPRVMFWYEAPKPQHYRHEKVA